jgi:hypothetical protein
MKMYFYSNGQKKGGPLTLEELKHRDIKPNTFIWYVGLDDWKEAETIDELREILELSPPPISSISEKTQLEPPPLYISNLNKIDKKIKGSNEEKETTLVSTSKPKSRSKMNKPLATTLAVFACIVLYFVLSALFIVLEQFAFGWKTSNDGGGLWIVAKLALIIYCIRLVWKKIRGLAY